MLIDRVDNALCVPVLKRELLVPKTMKVLEKKQTNRPELYKKSIDEFVYKKHVNSISVKLSVEVRALAQNMNITSPEIQSMWDFATKVTMK